MQFFYLTGHREHPSTINELTLKNIENLASLQSENFLQQKLLKKVMILFERVKTRANLEKACDFLRMSLTSSASLEKIMDPHKFSVI